VTRRLAYAQMMRGRARSEAELTFSRAQPATRTSAADILIDAAFVLEHLGGRDRRLLLLSIEGVPASDIARELGCHVHDIGQMVARARRKARRLMQ
jgi:DNA-directed RNA polymerase specialized sigma24 family protein